jgi:hypothetical protein
MCLVEPIKMGPTEIEDKVLRKWVSARYFYLQLLWVSDLGYWREDMRHIEEPHVSNNEWIRKCQY